MSKKHAKNACCSEMGYVLDPDSESDFFLMAIDNIESLGGRTVLQLSSDTQRIIFCPWCGQPVDPWLNRWWTLSLHPPRRHPAAAACFPGQSR